MFTENNQVSKTMKRMPHPEHTKHNVIPYSEALGHRTINVASEKVVLHKTGPGSPLPWFSLIQVHWSFIHLQ